MTVAITGNTYPVKERLKALGGRWNGDLKAWMVPDARADEARQIVANAPRSSARSKNTRQIYRRRYGWDGVVGSSSYYASGLYDEES